MITTEEAERIDGEFEEVFAIETVSTRQAPIKCMRRGRTCIL